MCFLYLIFTTLFYSLFPIFDDLTYLVYNNLRLSYIYSLPCATNVHPEKETVIFKTLSFQRT